jgi:hypothetical protein
MKRALRVLFFRSRTLRRSLAPIGAWLMGRRGIHIGPADMRLPDGGRGPQETFRPSVSLLLVDGYVELP